MRSLLIASLGNPGDKYAQTLHSAGHVLLSALLAYTNSPALSGKGVIFAKGPTSTNPEISTTFWKSPSYMNTSGAPLAATWRAFSSSATEGRPLLVILHDELELITGKFSFKTSTGGSARGHNGLKSFLSMPKMKELEFTRVGVGIGPRPESRAPNVVADYVLKRMKEQQREDIEGLARDVWKKLKAIQAKG